MIKEENILSWYRMGDDFEAHLGEYNVIYIYLVKKVIKHWYGHNPCIFGEVKYG